MSTAQPERRSKPRFSAQLPVSIRCGPRDEYCLGVSRDMNSSGIFLYTDLAARVAAGLGIGTRVELLTRMALSPEGGREVPVLCAGTVVRFEEEAAGRRGIAIAFGQVEILGEP